MPTFNSFDSALNLSKCFKKTPPLTFKIENLPKLPINWLTLLEKQCSEINPNSPKNIFLKHIGDNSPYKFKTLLKEQLSVLYHRISGNLDTQLGCLDSQASQLLIRLIEDINNCTEGFHIRVNSLVNSLHTPRGLDQLLYLVRKGIIQEIASGLINQDEALYQVHVADRVIRIAEKLDLGLTSQIKKDRYKGSLRGKNIRQVLKTEFPKHYTPLMLSFLLADQLNVMLNQYGYRGAKENGYTIGSAENILGVINSFLVNPSQNSLNQFESFFILDQIDEFNEPTRIYDVNWNLIRQLFLKKLINEGYLIEKPNPMSLIDYAYFQSLLPEDANPDIENRLINAYLESENYTKLLDDLHFIQASFSAYWQTLTKNPLLVKNIEKFFEFLKRQSKSLSTTEISKKFTLVYNLFFSQTKEYILSKIVKTNSFNLNIINDNLFFKSIQYHPEIIKELFTIAVNQYPHQPRIFFNLLYKVNSLDNNLLMLAARYHVETLNYLLVLINQQKQHFEQAEISALFITHNSSGWNLLSLAAKYNSNAINSIFDFIDENTGFFDFEIIKHIFNQKVNHEWCFLHYLIRFGSESAINRCLHFLSAKINAALKFIENEDWLALILNRAVTGKLIRIATTFKQSALKALLDFIGQHCQQLDARMLQDFFLETNEIDWSCLHAAAAQKAQENTVELELILQFISEHIDQFNGSSLGDLFLAKTECQHNFLQIAAYRRPASLNTIFEFLHRHRPLFDKQIFQQLLIQQADNGWNCLSYAYPHPMAVKNILGFIDSHPDSFPKEIIKEIILQENKHGYTSLHVIAEKQPDSLEVLLAFIGNKLDLFINDFNFLFQQSSRFQRINTFLKKPSSDTNLLALSSKHQPESAVHFSNFLNTHANIFNLKKPFLKNFIDKTVRKTVVVETPLTPSLKSR